MTEIILGVIIVALIVERYLFAKQSHKQQDHYMNALIAKNTNEYLAMREVEEKKEVPFKESDEVPLDQASDETFTKFIKENS